MKTRLSLALCGVFLLAGVAGAETERRGLWGIRPEVKGDASHLERRESASDVREGTPASALIYEAADPHGRYRWKPLWRREGLGGTAIAGGGAAPDFSGFWLAERIGEERGLNSALIVTGNNYTGQIASGVLLDEFKFGCGIWRGGGATLLAAGVAQPELDQPAAIVEIDFRKGVTRRWEFDKQADCLAEADSENLWIVAEGALWWLNLNNNRVAEVADVNGRGLAVPVPGARRLYLADTQSLRLLDYDGKVLRQWAFDGGEPVEAALAGPDNLLLRYADERAVLLDGGVLAALPDPVTAVAWLPGVDCYAVAWRVRQKLEFLTVSGESAGKDGKSRVGLVEKIFPLPENDGGFVTMGATGEFGRMTPTRKSFKYEKSF